MLAGGWKLLVAGSSTSLSTASTTSRRHQPQQQQPQKKQQQQQQAGGRQPERSRPLVRSPDAEQPVEAAPAKQAASETQRPDAEIKILAQVSDSQLCISIIEARNLCSQRAKKCNSFVRISFFPECRKAPKCQTAIVPDTDFPLFDRQFAIDLPTTAGADGAAETRDKNLLISVWNQLDSEGFSEFLGCVTLSMEELLSGKKHSAWHTLLNEMTRLSHPASQSEPPARPSPAPANQIAPRSYESKDVLISRAPNGGLGFTVSGSGPCHVSKVERRSPADAAGVRAGDYILQVDTAPVLRANNETVVRLLRNTGAPAVRLRLGRCSVAKSPSLPLGCYQRGPPPQAGQGSNGIRRDVKSLYDIASSHPSPSPMSTPQAAAAPQRVHFSHGCQLFSRPLANLLHSGAVSLLDAAHPAAAPAAARAFLFPDVLLLAGGEQQPLTVLAEPIGAHRILHCTVPQGEQNDVCLQYVGRNNRMQSVRIRCAHELESRSWCRHIKERQLKTFVL